MDGMTRIRKLFDGYSPKVYDGEFLALKKDWMEEHLKNAVIIGDTHFAYGRDHFTDLKFCIPWAKSGRKLGKNKEKTIETLTKEQQSFNNEVRAARSRVESPFGLFERRWKILQEPWNESEDQLNAFTFFICVHHNLTL
jgi:hypothetical protein